ncbi:MAG: SDR family oxidoreductase [Ktedonobacteraceae bacterium]
MVIVLVTGGTGTLGRAVIARLAARQYCIRLLARHSVSTLPTGVEVIAGDLVSGNGLDEALEGVHTIIHCASAYQDSKRVDFEGTRLLLHRVRVTETPHIVYPSIVGVDRSSYDYYQTKLATERLIEQGSLPWSIVRATQFHDCVLWLIHSFSVDTQPVVAVPKGMRFQSIDVGEVADRLVSLVEQGPGAHTPDLGGPQVRTIEDMTEAYLRICGKKAVIRSEAVVEDLFKVFTSGINLLPDHAVGMITWDAFLRNRYTLK